LISSVVGICTLEGIAILCIAMTGTTVSFQAKGVLFTEKGAEKVREFLDSQGADVTTAGLRVGVRGGGCSGFQYQLAFDEQRTGDVVFESHGLKLLIDAESLPFVRGSTIDYEEGLQGAGFKVNNPNVVAACGCGSSFRVAEEEQVSAV
jgi:iron-sulfur cluster assembly accessory protein